MNPNDSVPLRVSAAQVSGPWGDREAIVGRVVAAIDRSAVEGARLVAFGEAIVPGYPFWLTRTDGARFEDPDQKAMFAAYAEACVDIDAGHLEPVCEAARRHGIHVVLGVVERPRDRGGQTLYCSCVQISAAGEIVSVHRKLQPTYEERLVWGAGDGHGLRVHDVGAFRVGALNCWENWLPLARAALHGQGETLHVAIWPGGEQLTRDITRFIALEGRSFVISVSGLLRASDLPADTPLRERIVDDPNETFYDGGTAIAGPDGEWIVAPVVGEERIITVDLDPALVRAARQNLDISGHYSRPDVLELTVDRRRRGVVRFRDDSGGDDSDA